MHIKLCWYFVPEVVIFYQDTQTLFTPHELVTSEEKRQKNHKKTKNQNLFASFQQFFLHHLVLMIG